MTQVIGSASRLLLVASIAILIHSDLCAQVPDSAFPVQGTLTSPGSIPFHLAAVVTEGHDPEPEATIEMDWVAPDRWRRVIRSQEFTQTLIVNGDKVSEQDSDLYFPLGLQTLVTAMVDARPIVEDLQPDDEVRTKANGASNESGVLCYDAAHRMCVMGRFGMMETIGTAGHHVDFMDYQSFHRKRIARRLVYDVSVGDFMTASVTDLKDLKNPDPALFRIDRPTPRDRQIQVLDLKGLELQSLATNASDIIWPQVLDGATTGEATFYISVDRTGKVREVLPLRTVNERSNDSAIRQIMRWKFNPKIADGIPVQVEGALKFNLNTREYGPKEVLTDAEMRKLATTSADLAVPPGTVPPGSVKKIWVAVDADGYVIEWIAGDGPGGLTIPIVEAMKHWSFKPIYIDGRPMPYRGELVFRVN